jgi:hypothetical protein
LKRDKKTQPLRAIALERHSIDSSANLRDFSLSDPKIRVDWRRLADKKSKCHNPTQPRNRWPVKPTGHLRYNERIPEEKKCNH